MSFHCHVTPVTLISDTILLCSKQLWLLSVTSVSVINRQFKRHSNTHSELSSVSNTVTQPVAHSVSSTIYCKPFGVCIAIQLAVKAFHTFSRVSNPGRQLHSAQPGWLVGRYVCMVIYYQIEFEDIQDTKDTKTNCVYLKNWHSVALIYRNPVANQLKIKLICNVWKVYS